MALEVGKLAVCVKSHSQGVVKKGEVNEILGIKKIRCGCIHINIGIKCVHKSGIESHPVCAIHGDKLNDNALPYTEITDGNWWLSSILFAPIDSLTHEEVDAILDKILQEDCITK